MPALRLTDDCFFILLARQARLAALTPRQNHLAGMVQFIGAGTFLRRRLLLRETQHTMLCCVGLGAAGTHCKARLVIQDDDPGAAGRAVGASLIR